MASSRSSGIIPRFYSAKQISVKTLKLFTQAADITVAHFPLADSLDVRYNEVGFWRERLRRNGSASHWQKRGNPKGLHPCVL
jgi:hypothetical protein